EAIRETLGEHDVTVSPSDAPDSPGVEVPEMSFKAQLDEGHRVEVHAMLVDGVRGASRDFYEKYGELSRTSDLITYNGHSGLGSNIRALAQKGDWQQGQYSIVFMNGCDTYAYVDSALTDAHAEVNPDDDTGTKYVDLVMNAMPSYFSNMDRATMALITGLMSYDEPQTFERMFERISSSQVVLVSGEQDNTYVPGMNDDGHGDNPDDQPDSDSWQGLSKSGSVAAGEQKRYETPTLSESSYQFALSGSGDADLYVRLGEAPTTETYDCRPYRACSEETCEVELPSATNVHLMVRGGDDQTDFQLEGTRQTQ
ncbi:MAG: PPC domain-containing protein, partial [Bradymonadaceae bacterium]